MLKKLLIVSAAALLLGGCSLSAYLSGKGDAAKDQQPQAVSTPTPAPSLSSGTDDASLESDLGKVVIQDEDTSDLN